MEWLLLVEYIVGAEQFLFRGYLLLRCKGEIIIRFLKDPFQIVSASFVQYVITDLVLSYDAWMQFCGTSSSPLRPATKLYPSVPWAKHIILSCHERIGTQAASLFSSYVEILLSCVSCARWTCAYCDVFFFTECAFVQSNITEFRSRNGRFAAVYIIS